MQLARAGVEQILWCTQGAFRNARIGPHHFAGSTGYGHGDQGRTAMDQVIECIITRLISEH